MREEGANISRCPAVPALGHEVRPPVGEPAAESELVLAVLPSMESSPRRPVQEQSWLLD